MARHYLQAVLVLLPWLLAGGAVGQEKTDWLVAAETLETQGARLLMPVHQLLLGELEAESRKATQGGDAALIAALDGPLALARRDHEVLKAGRVPHPGGPNAAKDAFVLAANGLQWTLNGARNLKRVGIRNGTLHRFSEDGLKDGGTMCRQQLLPGMFSARRDDGGWSFFLISPDLEHHLCVISPNMINGLWGGGKKPLPSPVTAALAPASVLEPAAEPSAKGKESLRVLLERKFQKQLLEHEGKLVRLLESHLPEAGKMEGEAIQKRLQQARMAQEALIRPGTEKAPPSVETQAAFLTRLEGSLWLAPGAMIAGNRVLFGKDFVQAVSISGEVLQAMKPEVLWPGALRVRGADGAFVVFVFSPDLQQLIVLPVRAQYSGHRVD